MDFLKRYYEELESESMQFIYICGDDDRKILISAVKKSNLKEHVRLACIAAAFGYRKLLLKITALSKKHSDEFNAEFKAACINFPLIDGWINEFIDKTESPEAKQILRDFWSEKRSGVDPDNFNLGQLFT